MFKKVMNYFVIMALALSSAYAFTACSSDDDKEPENGKGNIVGPWKWMHSKGWQKRDGVIVQEWDYEYDYVYDYAYVFLSDGTMASYENAPVSDVRYGTYTYHNDELTINYLYDDGSPYFTETHTCTISGNKMKLVRYEEIKANGVEVYEEKDLVRIEN